MRFWLTGLTRLGVLGRSRDVDRQLFTAALVLTGLLASCVPGDLATAPFVAWDRMERDAHRKRTKAWRDKLRRGRDACVESDDAAACYLTATYLSRGDMGTASVKQAPWFYERACELEPANTHFCQLHLTTSKSGPESTCWDTPQCLRHGRCTETSLSCIVGSDADCRRSARCQEEGLCTLNGRVCVLAVDGCKLLAPCKLEGRCSLHQGACAVTKHADCNNTFACQTHGRCLAKDGRCVKSRREP
jgi:hypothetical protein